MKDIPVVLTIATLGSEARLPCHYCNEKLGISGRVWRRRNIHGHETEVNLDMHDDDTKNRVFVEGDHTLVIRNIKEDDGAYYFCYDKEDENGLAKMDILLDVGYRNPLEPVILDVPVELDKEVLRIMERCSNLKNVKSMSLYKCYAEWGQWSNCDVCGEIGKRRKIGECRLQKLVTVNIESPKGKEIEAEFPVVGVGCHSVLLNVVPDAKTILNKIPNIILTEKCKVSCEGYLGKSAEMSAHKKGSFLKKIKIKKIKEMKEVKQTIISAVKEEKEGSSLTLFCPGATLDVFVKWKFNERSLDPKKVKERTGGRISIDGGDALHIRDLRVKDSGEYICTLYDVEIGLIRLSVKSRYRAFDPTTNFGILTIVMLLCFITWIALMCIKYKAFKTQQHAQGRHEQSEDFSNDSSSQLLQHSSREDFEA